MSKQIMKRKKIICPQPKVWDEIYKKLKKKMSERKTTDIPEPPVPLILNGWWYSSDNEKRIRWEETILWCNKYNFSSQIPELSEEQSYFGENDDR